MNDDIVPGESRWMDDVKTPDGWRRSVFSDEVFWSYGKEYTFEGDKLHFHRVARFPFVPGYFMVQLCNDTTHYPVAGPFKTLKAAKAAVIIVGETDDADIHPGEDR